MFGTITLFSKTTLTVTSQGTQSHILRAAANKPSTCLYSATRVKIKQWQEIK